MLNVRSDEIAVELPELGTSSEWFASFSSGLNFASAVLRLPRRIYVRSIDMSAALEKVVLFARSSAGRAQTGDAVAPSGRRSSGRTGPAAASALP